MKPVGLIWEQIERGGMDGQYYKALVHEHSFFAVADEAVFWDGSTNTVTLKGYESAIGRTIDWTDPDAAIASGSVSVKDSNGNIFIEGTDYTVDYDNGTITRLPQGNIPRRTYSFVNYQWKIRCVDLSTGNPRMNCPQCGGKGFIWDNPIIVRGLFHIPNYDSPLTKIGYFEIGDAIFTVPYHWDFGVGPQGIDNLYLRDRIDIAGEAWRIMFKPQSIQMQNQFIAKKLHLRRLKYTPGVSQ